MDIVFTETFDDFINQHFDQETSDLWPEAKKGTDAWNKSEEFWKTVANHYFPNMKKNAKQTWRNLMNAYINNNYEEISVMQNRKYVGYFYFPNKIQEKMLQYAINQTDNNLEDLEKFETFNVNLTYQGFGFGSRKSQPSISIVYSDKKYTA